MSVDYADRTFLAPSHAGVRARPWYLLRQGLATLVSLFLFLMLWMLFAPSAIGGRASYVVTDGISMLPRFHGDGLVVTHEESNYRVGEVVAYHNKQLHAVVMHRIVARDRNRYVFKGDNNDYADQYHPTKSELVGKEWIYWPGGGRYLLILRNPWTFAVVVGGIAMFSFTGSGRSRRRRRHHAW